MHRLQDSDWLEYDLARSWMTHFTLRGSPFLFSLSTNLDNSVLMLLIFILLRKAKRAMVPNSMEANFKRERATGRERERERERGGREGGR